MPRGEHLNKPNGAATKETRAKGAHAANKARREKRERLIRVAEEKLEDALERAVTVYAEGLVAGSVVVSEDDNGEPIIATDHRTRIQAADRVTDRVLGKPVQRTEHTGADGGPVLVDHVVSDERAAEVFAGLEEVGLVRARPQNGDAPDDEVHTS